MSRYRAQIEESLIPTDTPCKPDPTPPSVPFAALSGLYRNPAYGDLLVCFAPSTSKVISQSRACADVIDRTRVVVPSALSPDKPTLVAELGALFTTHLRLEHFEGNRFNVSGLQSLVSGHRPFPPLLCD